MLELSKRSQWPIGDNALMRELAVLQTSQQEVIDLSESNPTKCQFAYLNQTILKDFTHSQNCVYTPHPQGSLAARESISLWYARQGCVVSPEDIFLTASTSEAYGYCLRLLADTGGEILAPKPGYPLFESLAHLSDVTLKYYRLVRDPHWRIALEDIQSQSDARALIVVSPHNPTGQCPTGPEASELVQCCARQGIGLVSDEVFGSFGNQQGNNHPIRSFANESSTLTFTINGVSKMVGLPQMKLAWLIVSGPAALKQEVKRRLEMMSDAFLSVNTPAQTSLGGWLELQPRAAGEINARLNTHRHYIHDSIQGTAWQNIASDAGWYAILSHPGLGDDEGFALKLLQNQAVFAYPGYFFGLSQPVCLVVSLIVPTPAFQRGIQGILKQLT